MVTGFLIIVFFEVEKAAVYIFRISRCTGVINIRKNDDAVTMLQCFDTDAMFRHSSVSTVDWQSRLLVNY